MLNKEIIEKGCVILNRADVDSLREIREYNEHVRECRYKMNRVAEFKYGFKILNPLVIFTLCICSDTMFQDPKTTIIILFLQVVSFCISISKNNYIIFTAVSSLLIFLDVTFIILFVANIILGGTIFFIESPLKVEPGYPLFGKIHIIYDEMNYMKDKKQLNEDKVYNDVWSR